MKKFATAILLLLPPLCFLFPYHLCPEATLESGGTFSPSLNAEMDITLDYEDCKAFYSALGRDDVSFDDEAQSITLPLMKWQQESTVADPHLPRPVEGEAIQMTVGEKLTFR